MTSREFVEQLASTGGKIDISFHLASVVAGMAKEVDRLTEESDRRPYQSRMPSGGKRPCSCDDKHRLRYVTEWVVPDCSEITVMKGCSVGKTEDLEPFTRPTADGKSEETTACPCLVCKGTNPETACHTGRDEWSVECRTCGARGPIVNGTGNLEESISGANAAWNRMCGVVSYRDFVKSTLDSVERAISGGDRLSAHLSRKWAESDPHIDRNPTREG